MKKYRFFRGLPSFYKILEDILKKFNITEEDLRKEVVELTINPYKATPIGNYPRFRKLRIKIPGFRGKRGGLRFIYYIDESEKAIIPIYIYFKGEKEDLTIVDLKKLESELAAILKQKKPRK